MSGQSVEMVLYHNHHRAGHRTCGSVSWQLGGGGGGGGVVEPPLRLVVTWYVYYECDSGGASNEVTINILNLDMVSPSSGLYTMIVVTRRCFALLAIPSILPPF